MVAGKGNLTGNNQYGNTNNVSISTDLFVDPEPAKKKADAGTSRAYALTRLKKERPDLFDRVCAKELSANAEGVGGCWEGKPDRE